MVGWVPSPLSRGLSGVPGFEVAPLAQFTPSSGLAVSGQERTSTRVVPPGGGGSAASEGWRCHSDLLESVFGKIRKEGSDLEQCFVVSI